MPYLQTPPIPLRTDRGPTRIYSYGHNYVGHNYIGHYYVGHNYIRDTCEPLPFPTHSERIAVRLDEADVAFDDGARVFDPVPAI